MTDDELSVDNAVDEVDLLVVRHGIVGGSYRFLRKHTTRKQWLRFTIFIVAYGLMVHGLTRWPIPSGFTVSYLSTASAMVWAAAFMAVMVVTYKGIGWLLSHVKWE